MLNEIRQGKKLRNKEDSDKWLEKQAAKKLGSKGDQLLEKANSPNEIRQEQLQEKSVKQDSRSQTDVARAISQNNNASSPSPSGGPPPPPSSNGTPLPEKANINIGSLLYNVVEQKFPDEIRCPSSDGNLSDPPDSNGWSSNGDEEQNKQSFASAQADASIETTYETDPDEELKNCKDEPLNFQPDNERERPDSACDASPFNLMEQILLDRRKLIYPSSDSNLSDLSDSNGWSSNGDKEQDKQSFASAQADASIEDDYETDHDEELRNCKDEPLKFQPDNERERPDSGYKSKPSSPLDFKSEAEKPQVPASLQEEPSVTKVNNVDPVNSRA